MDNALNVDGLAPYFYQEWQKTNVCQPVSFVCQQGQTTLLTGGNGAGKTSFLRALAGFHRNYQGSVQYSGMRVFMMHETHYDPHAQMPDIMRLWSVLYDTDIPCGIENKSFSALSSGQKRRLEILRLQASGASLWLLDEPELHLDMDGVELLNNALAAHSAAGGIAVIATHRVDFWQHDRHIVLEAEEK